MAGAESDVAFLVARGLSPLRIGCVRPVRSRAMPGPAAHSQLDGHPARGISRTRERPHYPTTTRAEWRRRATTGGPDKSAEAARARRPGARRGAEGRAAARGAEASRGGGAAGDTAKCGRGKSCRTEREMPNPGTESPRVGQHLVEKNWELLVTIRLGRISDLSYAPSSLDTSIQ